MTITTDRANSWLNDVMQGVHQPGDTYKIALIKTGHSGTYGPATSNYSQLGADEVGSSGTGYPAGGITLGTPTFATTNRRSRMDFPDPAAFGPANLNADGALLYNSSKGGKALGVFLFPTPLVASGGNVILDIPASGDNTSVLRIE